MCCPCHRTTTQHTNSKGAKVTNIIDPQNAQYVNAPNDIRNIDQKSSA